MTASRAALILSQHMKRLAKSLLFPGGKRGLGIALGIGVVVITVLYAPAVLAFPHGMRVGHTRILSTSPIPAVIVERIERGDKLLAESPLFEPGLKRTLVLTDGGWRWKILSAGHWDAVALRRPFSSSLLFNRADIAADRVFNSAPSGGERTLSGTIAHETVHILTARRYGEVRLARMPRWKREGYADYVARETSIGKDDERLIRERWPDSPLLDYYESRLRVEAALAANGHSVDGLLAED